MLICNQYYSALPGLFTNESIKFLYIFKQYRIKQLKQLIKHEWDHHRMCQNLICNATISHTSTNIYFNIEKS